MSRLGFMLLSTTTSLKFFQQTKQAESQIQLVHFKFNEYNTVYCILYTTLKLEQHHVICKVTRYNLTLDLSILSICLYEINPINLHYPLLQCLGRAQQISTLFPQEMMPY